MNCCKGCGTVDAEAFAPHAIRDKRRWCRECTRKRKLVWSGKDDFAKHLLCKLKQRCRIHKWPEGSVWRKEDVESLLKGYPVPEAALRDRERFRITIVHVDESKALLPRNACLSLNGKRLPRR